MPKIWAWKVAEAHITMLSAREGSKLLTPVIKPYSNGAPTDLSANSVRDEKVKVLRTIRRMDDEGVKKMLLEHNIQRAQLTVTLLAHREEDRGIQPA